MLRLASSPRDHGSKVCPFADIDECQMNATLCDQVCENTDGSFICGCLDGYELRDDLCRGWCVCVCVCVSVTILNQKPDIDECGGINGCQQVCENTEGSYLCNCTDGFTLLEDGRNCTGRSAQCLMLAS